MDGRLADRVQRRGHLVQQHTAATADLARTQARCEAARDRIGDLRGQRDDLQAQRDLLRAEVGALRARLETGPTPPAEG
ncbi:hypothetical protein GCM10027187_74830 [Streptosporangium sandarakinum]